MLMPVKLSCSVAILCCSVAIIVCSTCKRSCCLTCSLVERGDHAAYSAVWCQVRVIIEVAFVCQRTYAGPV